MSDFLAESKSPHELAVFMNEYFDALAQALKRHGVTEPHGVDHQPFFLTLSTG
jgi:class 3 adenylate cyclase